MESSGKDNLGRVRIVPALFGAPGSEATGRTERARIRRVMALFRRVLTSSHTKTSQSALSSQSSLALRSCPQSRWLPGLACTTAHAPYGRSSFFPPVLPRDGTAHSTSCTPLLVSSASPTFWLPPPVPSPEVDIAAWRRGRGGGRSASGEADPGLVFVNLPRSRRGQRQPRGWHGVLGPGGGVARRGRQREAVPGR